MYLVFYFQATQFEEEIWDILTFVHTDGSIPAILRDIDGNLLEDTVNAVHSQIKSYLLEGRVDENIGSFILLIGKRCVNLDSIQIGSEIIATATKILQNSVDKSSIKSIILPCAEAFILSRQRKFTEALQSLNNSLQNINEYLDETMDNQRNYLKFQLGYFMVKWNDTKSGMKILEETAEFYFNNMANMETLWRQNVNILCRFYNDQQKGELAYQHADTVIKKYHTQLLGPITSKNKTICEIASEILTKSSASSLLLETVSAHQGTLPSYVMYVIGEVIISFALKHNFHAVRMVEKYMNDCIEAHKQMGAIEEIEEDDPGILVAMKAKNTFDPFQKLKNVIKR